MKNKRLNRLILSNEVTKAYGKISSYLLYCLIPAAFVLLFSVLMYRAQQIGQGYRIGVYLEYGWTCEGKLEEAIGENKNVFLSETPFSKDEIRKNRVTVAILINQDITIIYSEELVSNPGALYEAQSMARKFSAILANETSYDEFQQNRINISEYDLAEEVNQGFFSLSYYFPIMYFFFVSIANMLVVILVLELFPGEKEKGVFDLLLLSGVSVRKLIAGKTLAILLSAYFSLLLGCSASVIGCVIFDHRLFFRLVQSISHGENLIAMLIFLFGFAVLMVMIQIYIASFFRTKESASAYSIFGTIVTSGASIIQVRMNNSIAKYIPIVNFIDFMQEMLNNRLEWRSLICCSLLAMVISAVLFLQASKQWEKERE